MDRNQLHTVVELGRRDLEPGSTLAQLTCRVPAHAGVIGPKFSAYWELLKVDHTPQPKAFNGSCIELGHDSRHNNRPTTSPVDTQGKSKLLTLRMEVVSPEIEWVCKVRYLT